MEFCNIFLTYVDLEPVMNKIAEPFGEEKFHMDFYICKKTNIPVLSIACNDKKVKFSVNTPFSTSVDVVKKLQDIYENYRLIETELVEIKENVLKQIELFNCIIEVEFHRDFDEFIRERIKYIVEEVCGFIWLENGDLLDDRGRLVFSYEGETDLNKFYPIMHKDVQGKIYGKQEYEETDLSIRRKNKSINILKERNVPVYEHLHVIEDEETAQIRSKEDVAKRAIGLCIVALYAECLLGEGMSVKETREFISDITSMYDADDYFSQVEKEYMNNDDPDEITSIQFAWKYESYWVMLWALGFIHELKFPEIICDVPKSVGILREYENFDEFCSAAKLRTSSELLDEADLILRYNWACVDARANGMKAPSTLDSGVVQERHKSLNWLIGHRGHDWDHVKIDT